MLKFRNLFLVITLFLAFLIVNTPLVWANQETAGAKKVALFNLANPEDYTCEGGGNPSDETLGFAVINTNGKPSDSKQVKVTVSLKNAQPYTTYQVWISQHPGDCTTTVSGNIVTDENGDASEHFSKDRLEEATNFWVSVTGGGQTLRSPAVILD